VRKLMLCIVVAAIASNASAAVVTYTMSYNDNGSGGLTFNNWAVYASVSPDSAGLFSFSVDLLPYTSGGVFLNRANGVIMEDSSIGEQLNLGFTTDRIQDVAAGRFSGSADLSAGSALKPVYGIGQTAGKLDSLIPPNFDTQIAVFGAGRITNYGAETFQGKNLFLLARGTWAGAAMPDFDKQSADSNASIYLNNTSTQNAVASIVYQYRDGHIDPFELFQISSGAGGTNQAVDGAITVTGSSNNYASEVDQLLSDANSGHAPVQTIGDEAGNLYVMAKITGTAIDVAAVLSQFNNTVGDPQAALLHSAYDAQFGPGGFNLLYKRPNYAGAKFVNWDLGFHPSARVDMLAVVPEPACIGIVGCVTILLSRRRNRAWCD